MRSWLRRVFRLLQCQPRVRNTDWKAALRPPPLPLNPRICSAPLPLWLKREESTLTTKKKPLVYLWSQRSGRIEQTLWSCFNISRPPGHTDSWHMIRLRAVGSSDSSPRRTKIKRRHTLHDGKQSYIVVLPWIPCSCQRMLLFFHRTDGGRRWMNSDREGGRKKDGEVNAAGSFTRACSTSVLGASWQSLANLSSAAFWLKRVHTCDADDDCSNLVIFILPSHILGPTSCRKTFRLRQWPKIRWDAELFVLELSHYFLLKVLWLRSPFSVTWLCPKESHKNYIYSLNLTLTNRFLGSTFAGIFLSSIDHRCASRLNFWPTNF